MCGLFVHPISSVIVRGYHYLSPIALLAACLALCMYTCVLSLGTCTASSCVMECTFSYCSEHESMMHVIVAMEIHNTHTITAGT